MEFAVMATIKRKTARDRQFGGFTPYGNVTSLVYSLLTNATGAVIDSDSTAAIAVGDVIDLGELPEGMNLQDAQIIVSTGMTATIKGNLGFQYSDENQRNICTDSSCRCHGPVSVLEKFDSCLLSKSGAAPDTKNHLSRGPLL